jgi:hypothetical protein
MSTANLLNLLGPFKNLTQFLQVLQIIKLNYCESKKNFGDVTCFINETLGTCLIPTEVATIIQNVQQFPAFYGFEFVVNYNQLEKELHLLHANRDHSTFILTPIIEVCMFCKKDNQLIIKSDRSIRDGMLYTQTRIGNYL